MSRSPIPKYRRDSKGRAFVQHRAILNKSHRMYLGKWGAEDSVRRYRTFLAKLEAARSIDVGFGPIQLDDHNTIDALIVAYLEWAEKNYTRPEGVGSEYDCMKYALGPLSMLFGEMLASEFGPRHFTQLRSHFASKGHVRTSVNRSIGRVKRFWRWCCERELAPAELYHKLLCVSGLYPGQENVTESTKRGPADLADAKKLLPFVSTPIAAMIRVQYLCGMRPGETCIMRLCDIDHSGDVWLYRPQRHKTAWRGFSQVKAIPKVAQPIIWQGSNGNPMDYIFRPRQPMKANGKRRGERYTTSSYRGALDHGFAKAEKHGVEIKRFTPNQLRHAILSDVSRMLGQQAAQRWAGHEDLDTTNIYTGLRVAELVEIAGKLDERWQSPPC